MGFVLFLMMVGGSWIECFGLFGVVGIEQ